MRKKSIISTILFLVIAFIGCQKNNIQQSKNYEERRIGENFLLYK